MARSDEEQGFARTLIQFFGKHYMETVVTAALAAGGTAAWQGNVQVKVDLSESAVESFERQLATSVNEALGGDVTVESDDNADFGVITPVFSATFVQVTVKAAERERSVVCGYVSSSRAELENRDENTPVRSAASAHYGFETDAPVSSLSMLAKAGEFWLVDYCVGEDPLTVAPSIHVQSIHLTYGAAEDRAED